MCWLKVYNQSLKTMSHGKAHRITNEKKKLAKKKLNMKLIFTNFPKFNILNITLKDIRFSIF